MNAHGLIAAALLLASPFFVPHPARAAQSYDNCTGYIDSLPATISTGGTWCLRKDLATNIASGSAINIASNDVTVDCNDFKIGGLAAGTGSATIGILSITNMYAPPWRNTTIRHCSIRGFETGIAFYYAEGALIEDNRLDGNLYTGIEVHGSHNRIRRNAVFDTGGKAGVKSAMGILAYADITDNIVDGLFTDGDTFTLYGIDARGAGSEVSRNRVGGFAPKAAPNVTARIYGIHVSFAPNVAIAGNRISAPTMIAATDGFGILGNSGFCSGNTVANFAYPVASCADDGGNASN